MTFPFAYKGVKKIFISEILTIVSVIIMVVSGILALALIKAAQQSDDAAAGAVAAVVTFLCGTCLSIPAFILYLVGILQAKKDEQQFYYAFVFVIMPIIASVFAALFREYQLVQNIAQLVTSLCEVIAMIMIITGIRELASRLGNVKMVNSANLAFRMITGVYALLIIARVVEFVFDFLPAMVVLGAVLSVAAGILDIVAHIYYFIYLGRAVKMLKA